ncbi:MAG: FkbM family methyltransferase [Thermoleophilaceae bacterium]|nr:FkbM family methyltransferase [Thermoleophilaceae bacterium]
MKSRTFADKLRRFSPDPPARPSFDAQDPNKRDLLGFAELVMRRQGDSSSQLGADLWVLHELSELQGGYFVEFGAGDGHHLSNTWLLEAHYGWTGILAEPNAMVFESLRAHRPNCRIDPRAVHREDATTRAMMVTEIKELSALTEFAGLDMHAEARREGELIDVETVTLDRLLDDHAAPELINYLSIDTEGGEYEILEGFDFERRTVDLISVEHSYLPKRESIQALLDDRGYERRYIEHSKFDDWYLRRARCG